MNDSAEVPRRNSEPAALDAQITEDGYTNASITDSSENNHTEPVTPGYLSPTPGSPYILSRNSSSYFSKDFHDGIEGTPMDRITILDIFGNLSLPSKLEKFQTALSAQKERVLKQQQTLKSRGSYAREKAVTEWRKRVPTADDQLAKYRKRVKKSIDDVNKRWTETVTISTREKISFISAVLNIFISGYLLGAIPERFYWWFTVQFAYFMPIRFYTYHRKGYHYFLADLCYFVNALCLLAVWVFPQSKRVFISSYCLAYGNNAVAIVMWRNSLVFHSLDKVTSLFIHVMPPVTFHALVHLTPSYILAERFPAIFNIKFSQVTSPDHYSLLDMLTWATLPYGLWQLSYHFLITVRRREKIAAGRPTSFTWLRKSYAKTWIGKVVLALPESLQEPAFMFIQYFYAILTIIPCPIWFWYRWASAAFLMFVFSWSVWNGANYYMDVFGKQFQNELEQMKKDMAKLQGSPGTLTPVSEPHDENGKDHGEIDKIPLLDEKQNKNLKEDRSSELPSTEDADTAIMSSIEKKLDST